MVGEAAPSTLVAAAELIVERIEGADLAVVPDGAQMSNIEHPEAFNVALPGLLAGVPNTTGPESGRATAPLSEFFTRRSRG